MSKLVGKWYNVSTTANGETELYDNHEPCGKDYVEFTSNNIKIGDVFGCDGNTPEITVYTGATYTTSGNEITVETTILTVKKLTSSDLKLSYKDDWDGDGDEETVSETYTSTP